MKNTKPVALTCLAAGALGVSCSPQEEPKALNVLYILADDLGYGDLGCYGQAVIRTPNIDRLAASGMQFSQHYSGCTVSAPSRSALMTGLHTGHTYIRGNKPADKALSEEGQEPLPTGTYTLARMFSQAGYATGAFGKWGLGYPDSDGDPLNQGFDRFYGYNCQSLAHKYYPDHLWDDSVRVELDNTETVQTQYAQDLIHVQALTFIEENRDKPFFLFLPYVLPHAELLAPEDGILESYEGRFDEVPYDGGTLGGYGAGMNWRAYASQEEPYAHFAAMITRLDAYVGEVVAKLAELGLTENTLVVFTSDNGPHEEGGANPAYFQSWGPLRGTKRDMYEGGIRVPMIASLPGTIEAGSKSDHVSAFWDVLPTFAELIGAELPVETDGVSFLPTLTGRGEQPQHDYLYWEFHERGGKIAVRRGYWKAIRQGVSADPNAPIELYDLSTDLHEDRNVADQHPDEVARMDEIMKSARTESPLFPF
jgi:arylsulfatase A-like enzyme